MTQPFFCLERRPCWMMVCLDLGCEQTIMAVVEIWKANFFSILWIKAVLIESLHLKQRQRFSLPRGLRHDSLWVYLGDLTEYIQNNMWSHCCLKMSKTVKLSQWLRQNTKQRDKKSPSSFCLVLSAFCQPHTFTDGRLSFIKTISMNKLLHLMLMRYFERLKKR